MHTLCDGRTVAAAEAQPFPGSAYLHRSRWLGSRAGRGLADITASKPGAARGARVGGRAQAQRLAVAVVIVAGMLLSVCGSVMAQTSAEKQAQCELSAIRDTRSAVAIQFIRSACNWLALNGDSLLNEGGKNYHACLVQQLSGVQADEAAGAIVSACRTSYPP